MISNKDFALIAALDLNPIKGKLMHKESGEGWSLEHANAMEIEYRRFLYLMKAFPNEQTAPLVDVDTFWHYHILDTMKYARDCEQAFGYFLHHYPYVGMDTEDGAVVQQQAGTRMRELYESTFGESYVRAAGVMCQRAQQEAANDASGDRVTGTAANAGSYAQAADVQAAWCGIFPETKAAGVDTAWCGIFPAAKAGEAKTAWCGIFPAAKVSEAKTAWCGIFPDAKASEAKTAWCGIFPGAKASEAKTAWCGIFPDAKAADVQTACRELAQAA